MRIFSPSILTSLSIGFIGLLFVPLLEAQEYPADITRAKVSMNDIARPATVSQAGGRT